MGTQGIIYLMIHTKSGKEFVGSAQDTFIQKVQFHFKAALFSSAYTAKNRDRELHHAIRMSNVADWRVVILESNIPIESLVDVEKGYVVKLNTAWPKGFNYPVESY